MFEALLGVSKMAGGAGIIEQLPKPSAVGDFRAQMGMCLSPDKTEIYVAGGTNSQGAMNLSFAKYNVANRTWTALAALPLTETRMPKMQFVGATLVIIIQNNVLLYNPATNVWTKKPGPAGDSVYYTYGGATDVRDNKLITFGQADTVSLLPTMYTYDPITNLYAIVTQWSPKIYWTGQGGVIVGNRFYIAGGNSPNPNALHWYDFISGTWGSRAIPGPYYGGLLVADKGKVYLLGASPDVKGCIEYNPATDGVLQLPNLPTMNSSVGGVALDGLIYTWGSEAPASFYTYKLPVE